MEIFILFLLIIVNGFFAMSEIALVSSKKAALEELGKQGKRGAVRALQLLENSEIFLSAIQVGITLIGLVTGIYGGMNIADDIAPFLQHIPYIQDYARESALVLTVIIITYISIIFGELVPKTVGMNNPERIAVLVSTPIHFFSKAFYPFVWLLSVSTNTVNRMLGIQKGDEHITTGEIRSMIRQAYSQGLILQEQNRIHEQAFSFAHKKAKHLMTHRTDVEWIDIDWQTEEIITEMKSFQHSKIVCCQGSLDNVLGIVRMSDYFRHVLGGNNLQIEKIIQPVSVLPDSTEGYLVLEHLRKEQGHICLIVNAYGGFEGVITLHDILENFVGTFAEENEVDEQLIFRREDGSFLISGEASVEILEQIMDGFRIDFEEVDYSTVAGFVVTSLQKIPAIGDKFLWNNYCIEVVDLDGKRVDKVMIYKQDS